MSRMSIEYLSCEKRVKDLFVACCRDPLLVVVMKSLVHGSMDNEPVPILNGRGFCDETSVKLCVTSRS